MNDLDKRINILLQLIFIAAITLTIWNGIEGVRLNERYERSIQRHEQSTKQYEQSVKEYNDYLQSTKARIEERIREIEQAKVN
ncbi:hypothetical protein MKX34_26815 [Paenibacillus sp. FSL R5-0636]|uniref:hypothetical protein n=1 Tax=Paenibacillus TaxID=44249 RepID=UPI00096FD494|nr:hypothetical protein [Paenibacillus odorifer]OMD00031.1 hypothetical protein BJP49_28460 [Paenibacillus odorifer]